MMQKFLPAMINLNEGSIVSMCSIAGHMGTPYMVPYSASKHGVKGDIDIIYNSAVCFLYLIYVIIYVSILYWYVSIQFRRSIYYYIGMVEALHQELRYSHPDNKIHLMNVSPFIIDTGMVKGASIRFPSMIATSSKNSKKFDFSF